MAKRYRFAFKRLDVYQAAVEPPTGEPEGAQRPKGIESPRSGVAEAAQPPPAIERRD